MDTSNNECYMPIADKTMEWLAAGLDAINEVLQVEVGPELELCLFVVDSTGKYAPYLLTNLTTRTVEERVAEFKAALEAARASDWHITAP